MMRMKIPKMAAMMLVGRLSGKVDPRALILLGLGLISFSLWRMSLFNLDTPGRDIVVTGITQGLGLGFIFVPLSTLTFSTLAPRYRNEATALYSLMRNIGSSIGISVVISYLAQRVQINHAAYADYLDPSRLPLQQAVASGALELASPQGLARANQLLNQQAATLAYLQDFRLMMWITLAAMPLLLLLRQPARRQAVPAPAPPLQD